MLRQCGVGVTILILYSHLSLLVSMGLEREEGGGGQFQSLGAGDLCWWPRAHAGGRLSWSVHAASAHEEGLWGEGVGGAWH